MRVTELTPEGEAVDTVYSGLRARVLQHEVDHLDGILYVDRMTDFTRFGFAEEILQAQLAAFEAEATSAPQDETSGEEVPTP